MALTSNIVGPFVDGSVKPIIFGNGFINPIHVDTSPSIGVQTIPDFNAAEGAIYVDFTDLSFLTSDNSVLLAVTDGTANNRIFVQKYNASGGRVRTLTTSGGGVNEGWDEYKISFYNGSHRFLVEWSADTFEIWWNGFPMAMQDGNYSLGTFTQVEIGELLGGFTSSAVFNEYRVYGQKLPLLQKARLTGDVVPISGITKDAGKDLFFFEGQSNSVGIATGTPSYTNTSSMFLLSNALTSIGSYSDPYDASAGARITAISDGTAAGSYAGYFADNLAGLSGRDIVVCPANLASTSFRGSTPTWRVDSDNSFYLTNGTKFTGMLATVVAACNQMQIGKLFANPKGVIWGQGEGDAVAGTSEADYENDLTNLITIQRNMLGFNLPWFNCSMPNNTSNWAGSGANWNNINDAQVDVAGAMSGVYMVEGTDIQGNPVDRKHYDQAGNASVGATIATEVDARLY